MRSPFRDQKMGEKLIKAALVGVTIFSFLVHLKHNFSIKMDVMINLLSAVYLVPWTRVGPYFVGTLAAIFIKVIIKFALIVESSE